MLQDSPRIESRIESTNHQKLSVAKEDQETFEKEQHGDQPHENPESKYGTTSKATAKQQQRTSKQQHSKTAITAAWSIITKGAD